MAQTPKRPPMKRAKAIVENAGPGAQTGARVLRAAQRLYNAGYTRYTRGLYDPTQIAVVAKGRQFLNLNTGETSASQIKYASPSSSRYISGSRLDALRAKYNYNPANAAKYSPFGKNAQVVSYTGPTGLTSYTTVTALSAASMKAGGRTDRFYTGGGYASSAGAKPARAKGPNGPSRRPPSRSTNASTNGAASTSPPAYAEADATTTGLIRAQGKAYARGRTSNAGYAAGQTGKTIRPGDQTPTPAQKKRAARLAVRGKRQKSGVKKGYHINKAGNVVPNKGRQNKPKPGK